MLDPFVFLGLLTDLFLKALTDLFLLTPQKSKFHQDARTALGVFQAQKKLLFRSFLFISTVHEQYTMTNYPLAATLHGKVRSFGSA
ncbi:hypothetical protein TUM3792_17420 [Shewanella sp. MBTL60-007]|nr:hypothetical protein TUM3792_17420 [Shewanella sp. MBTL60-007]